MGHDHDYTDIDGATLAWRESVVGPMLEHFEGTFHPKHYDCTECDHDLKACLPRNALGGQHVDGVVAACVDSRSPVGATLGLPLGAFLGGNNSIAAIIPDPETMDGNPIWAQIDVAMSHGGSNIIILGHTQCGGVANGVKRAFGESSANNHLNAFSDREIKPAIDIVFNALGAKCVDMLREMDRAILTSEVEHQAIRSSALAARKGANLYYPEKAGQIKIYPMLFDMWQNAALFGLRADGSFIRLTNTAARAEQAVGDLPSTCQIGVDRVLSGRAFIPLKPAEEAVRPSLQDQVRIQHRRFGIDQTNAKIFL